MSLRGLRYRDDFGYTVLRAIGLLVFVRVKTFHERDRSIRERRLSLRVIRRLPVTWQCGAFGGQASDKPRGRKPRAGMGRTVRRAGCRDRPIERLNDGPIPQINWPPERNRKVHRSTKRFHRIRHYGLLASAACKANIARQRTDRRASTLARCTNPAGSDRRYHDRPSPAVPLLRRTYDHRRDLRARRRTARPTITPSRRRDVTP